MSPPVRTAIVLGADSMAGLALCQHLFAQDCRHLVAACDSAQVPDALRPPNGTTLELVLEPVGSVIGAARLLELLRQRQPWQLLALLAADVSGDVPNASDGVALRGFLRRELEAPLLLAQAAQALAQTPSASLPQLWLLPPVSDQSPSAASVCAALQAFVDSTHTERLVTRVLPRQPAPDWDALLASLNAAAGAQ